MFNNKQRWLAVLLGGWCTLVSALDLELNQGVNALLPIGVHSFGREEMSQGLTQLIQHDLQLSGQFKLIPDAVGIAPTMGYWQRLGADSVLMGEVKPLGNQKFDVRYQLMDPTAGGQKLLSKSYQVNASQMRALAHHISDEVYQKLTGERGVFSTHIAYVMVRRTPQKTQYSLEVADMDGGHPQSLLISSEPIMSPTWSPDGRQIAYVSFETKRAQIFTVNVATGQRRLLTNFSGINGAPAWSPDGRSLAVVLSKSGSPKIYSVDLSTGQMKQLTFGPSIDTEPRYSPDARSILFTSGRGGSPQIYRLSLSDGQITRVSYDGKYNARAAYTPNQQKIVMLHRDDQQFNIGVQPAQSTSIMLITHSPMDESPSIAPNGRMVVYATLYQNQGVIALVSIDGRVNTRLPMREGDLQEPAWSPFVN